jgi:hypothetical protein
MGLEDGDNSFYYRMRCKVRFNEFIKTGYDTGGDLYLACLSRRRNASTIKAEPLSQPLYDSPSPSSF